MSYSGGSSETLCSLREKPRVTSTLGVGDRVAEPARGEVERSGHVLDLDLRLEPDAGALGALVELAAHRVDRAPARVVEDRRRGGGRSIVLGSATRCGLALT